MTGRHRLEAALGHREPDRIPFDLGATPFSGITRIAYRNYIAHRRLDLPEPPIQDVKQQLARPDERLLEELGVDTRPVRRGRSGSASIEMSSDGRYESYYDEWGLGWRRPLPDGLYFDLFDHPLRTAGSLEELKAWHWPDPLLPSRFEGMAAEVEMSAAGGHALVMGGLCAGVMEMALWLRGYDRFLLDLAARPELADGLIGRLVDLKLAYWQRALEWAGKHVSVCYEADDLGAQESLLLSPQMYRRLVKPHHRRLIAGIKAAAPHVRLLYHSDGAIAPLIPDLIEIGVDILNPIQVSAAGMDNTARLKREFGRDLVFWGGGCDSQHVLPHGTPEQVRAEVKRRIGELAPGGGYVFASVHNLQADVPPRNLEAMWQTFREEAGY